MFLVASSRDRFSESLPSHNSEGPSGPQNQKKEEKNEIVVPLLPLSSPCFVCN